MYSIYAFTLMEAALSKTKNAVQIAKLFRAASRRQKRFKRSEINIIPRGNLAPVLAQGWE